jgi:hypothetical protein
MAILKDGWLEKRRERDMGILPDEWKKRWCELIMEGAAPVLIYRQKAGKRELGRAFLGGASVTRGTESSDKSAFTIVDRDGLEFTFSCTEGGEKLSTWMQAIMAQTGQTAQSPGTNDEAPAPPPDDQPPSDQNQVQMTVLKDGWLEKRLERDMGKLSDEWKKRWCELIMEGAAPVLIYRQKAGKRELGRAFLGGASISVTKGDSQKATEPTTEARGQHTHALKVLKQMLKGKRTLFGKLCVQACIHLLSI